MEGSVWQATCQHTAVLFSLFFSFFLTLFLHDSSQFLPLIFPLNIPLWVLHIFVWAACQICSFSFPFLFSFFLSLFFRDPPVQSNGMLILSSASILIAQSSLFAGPCWTSRRQRIIGTVCLSHYTQILWGGGKQMNFVTISNFIKSWLIFWFSHMLGESYVGRLAKWDFRYALPLHVCCSGLWEKELSRLLFWWQLFLTPQNSSHRWKEEVCHGRQLKACCYAL